MKHELEHRTQRRTKAEIALAKKIQTLHAKKKPDAAKAARATRLSNAAKKSPRFEYNRGFSTLDQLPIKYFHFRGESVTGILGEPDQQMWQGSTYSLLQDDGRVIRLAGNRLLHKAIETGGYIGQRVTITYDGKHYYRFGGHYQKAYTIVSHDLEEQQKANRAAVEAAKNADSRKVLEEAAAGGNPFAKKMLARKAKEGKGK